METWLLSSQVDWWRIGHSPFTEKQWASKYLVKAIVYVFLSQKGMFSFVVQISFNVVTAVSM